MGVLRARSDVFVWQKHRLKSIKGFHVIFGPIKRWLLPEWRDLLDAAPWIICIGASVVLACVGRLGKVVEVVEVALPMNGNDDAA